MVEDPRYSSIQKLWTRYKAAKGRNEKQENPREIAMSIAILSHFLIGEKPESKIAIFIELQGNV